MTAYEGYEALRFERHGDVLEATIDRPGSELNAIDGTLHSELARLFRELKREREARAVLLTGSKKAFSAGGDFGWFPTLDSVATPRPPSPRRPPADLGPGRHRAAGRGRAQRPGGRAGSVGGPAVRRDRDGRHRGRGRPARAGGRGGRRRRRGDLAAARRTGPGQAVPAHRRPAHRGRGRADRPGQRGGTRGRRARAGPMVGLAAGRRGPDGRAGDEDRGERAGEAGAAGELRPLHGARAHDLPVGGPQGGARRAARSGARPSSEGADRHPGARICPDVAVSCRARPRGRPRPGR